MALSTAPTINARRPRMHQVTVDRHALVGDLMDLEALAREAVHANGCSLATVLRLPAGPWRDEMQAAHHATHDALVALYNAARMAAGRYDHTNGHRPT